MPVFPKRRFQHGSVSASQVARLFPRERGTLPSPFREAARSRGVSASAADQRIRSLRPPKAQVDPYTAHGSLLEEERRPDGRIERALTVFLSGAECPFTCSFCDLWRFTIDGPTPPGALTTQLEKVLDTLDRPLPDRLKLYNASNFFDERAVPSEDLAGIARLAAPFAAVTVESHASTIGPKTLAFAQRIPGRLEVAVGLETIHPVAAAQLNKRLDLARFDLAAGFLAENGIDLRVFVLLGTPYVPVARINRVDCARRRVRGRARGFDRIDYPGSRRKWRNGTTGGVGGIHTADVVPARGRPRPVLAHHGRGRHRRHLGSRAAPCLRTLQNRANRAPPAPEPERKRAAEDRLPGV